MIKRVKNSDSVIISDEMRIVLSSIKDQFDDHLVAINENTNEIQGNYEFLCEIDSKIEKLNERIDKIELMLNGKVKESSHNVRTLTLKEQEVFLVIYTADGFLTYDDISRKTGFTSGLIRGYLTSIIAKGIPVIKRYVDKVVYLSLDREFTKLQAQKGIVKVDDSLAASFLA